MKKYTKNFTELDKSNADIAGGKGASLGEMTHAGIPVPPGFVVLSSTFDKFLHETDLTQEITSILETVNHKEIHTVDGASEKIQELIKNVVMPEDIALEIREQFKKLDTKYVAVRSSATAEDGQDHAWAGQLDSFLNTTERGLLEKVQRCWASLFTPRAIFYRFEKGLYTTQISVAVVVQKMVNSEISGIAFSVHPVTEDRNQLIIEAGFGLGEAIVSGAVTPDSYVVEKDSRKIIDINISTQSRGLYRVENGGSEWVDIKEPRSSSQVLNEKQISELSDIIICIENHYGFPVDTEWAFEGDKFYIVQSRPITTLKSKHNGKPNLIDGVEWKLAVTRNMSFFHDVLNHRGGALNTKDFGVNSSYYGLFVVIDGTSTSAFIDPTSYGIYANAVMEIFSTKESIDKLCLKYKDFSDDLLQKLEVANQSLNIETWKDFSDSYQRFTAGLMITTHFGRVATDKLVSLLQELGVDEKEIPHIVSDISYPDEFSPMFKSQVALTQIGAGIQNNKIINLELELEKWLQDYGFIPVNFCDEPWDMNNAKEQLSQIMKKDCSNELDRINQQHIDRIKNRDLAIQKIGNNDVEILAFALTKAAYLNEFRKNVFCKVSFGFRNIFSKVAKLGGSDNWRDCFYLKPEEIGDLIGGGKVVINDLLKGRRVMGLYINNDNKEITLSDEQLNDLEGFVKSNNSATQLVDDSTGIIKGFSANKGKITGTVRIVLSSKDFYKLNSGDILVTTMTSVDFVPVMQKAGAFVTNEGGITSHASIVAREMGKPCIIGTKIATKFLKDGDFVEVDAERGIIRLINK